MSVNEALRLISSFSGRELDVKHLDSELGDVRNTGADTTRAREDLGFDPATTLEDGLRAEFEWMSGQEQQPVAAPRP